MHFALIQLIQGDDQSLEPLDHFQSMEQWLMSTDAHVRSILTCAVEQSM
jgi:hypothetical protein